MYWLLCILAPSVTLFSVTFGNADTVKTDRPFALVTRETFALHIDELVASPHDFAVRLGQYQVDYLGPVGELDGHHRYSVPEVHGTDVYELLEECLRRKTDVLDYDGSPLDALRGWQKLKPREVLEVRRPPPIMHLNTSSWTEDGVAVAAQQALMKTLKIADPGFVQQWHLFNTIQPGHDMNVTGLWLEGITGDGVVTAVIDNGLDASSADLASNVFAAGSYDFVEDEPYLPPPNPDNETHGTRCAGEIAAVKNGLCGLGMAYDSKVSGIRLLSGKPLDESIEAAALNYEYHSNDIYSCSWGPSDNAGAMAGPSPLVQRAFMNGVQNGRGGRGSVYVFAAGNGGFLGDNCNFDGYANSIYTITVGAVTREGKSAEYTEPCAAQLAVAYTSAAYQSGGLDAVYTTDVGVASCTHAHGGTSAAGPLAASAIALALSVRPDLSWRDVQWLLYETAVPMNVEEEGNDWQSIGSTGKMFSHRYGFGKIDTYTFVHRAQVWELVKPQAWLHSPLVHVHKAIPEGAEGATSRLQITPEDVRDANLQRLEHVTVTINVHHTRRGDLSVELRSPGGMVSYLSTSRTHDHAAKGYDEWTFSSVAHWNEPAVGVWELVVKDTRSNNFTGTFVDWHLGLWGEAVDEKAQGVHPFPELSGNDEVDGDDGRTGSLLSDDLETPHVPQQHLSATLMALSWPSKAISIARQLFSGTWWVWSYGAFLLIVSAYAARRLFVRRTARRRYRSSKGHELELRERGLEHADGQLSTGSEVDGLVDTIWA